MKFFCMSREQLKAVGMEPVFRNFTPEYGLFFFSASSPEGDLFNRRMAQLSRDEKIDFPL